MTGAWSNEVVAESDEFKRVSVHIQLITRAGRKKEWKKRQI